VLTCLACKRNISLHDSNFRAARRPPAYLFRFIMHCVFPQPSVLPV
jgi:hypothetical protein